jgi:hypothetical protein
MRIRCYPDVRSSRWLIHIQDQAASNVAGVGPVPGDGHYDILLDLRQCHHRASLGSETILRPIA